MIALSKCHTATFGSPAASDHITEDGKDGILVERKEVRLTTMESCLKLTSASVRKDRNQTQLSQQGVRGMVSDTKCI